MSKLEIYAGKEFSADFTVVSADGVTGVELVAGDTATFTLSTSGAAPACVIEGHSMTIVDAINGVFNLTLTPLQTSTLKQDVGFKEDRYSTISNYTGFLDFVLTSGNRQATIDMYVKEVGCQTV